MENEKVKLHWDTNIQCDHVVEARRPDIIVESKKENKCVLVDIVIPGIAGYMKNLKYSKNVWISSGILEECECQ